MVCLIFLLLIVRALSIEPTSEPTMIPTILPTDQPTNLPIDLPTTVVPTNEPTNPPTNQPTELTVVVCPSYSQYYELGFGWGLYLEDTDTSHWLSGLYFPQDMNHTNDTIC